MTVAELLKTLRPSIRARVVADWVNKIQNDPAKCDDFINDIKDVSVGTAAIRRALGELRDESNTLRSRMLAHPDGLPIWFECVLDRLRKHGLTMHERLQIMDEEGKKGLPGTEFLKYLLSPRQDAKTDILQLALTLNPDPKKISRTVLARKSQQSPEFRELLQEIGWSVAESERSALIYTAARDDKPEKLAKLELTDGEVFRLFRIAARNSRTKTMKHALALCPAALPSDTRKAYTRRFHYWAPNKDSEDEGLFLEMYRRTPPEGRKDFVADCSPAIAKWLKDLAEGKPA